MIRTNTLKHWIESRGLQGLSLAPRLSDLIKPDEMADREIVVTRICDAIRKGEEICVFGDFDCDGIGACVILTEGIRALGGRVTPMLASRYDGGYGFSDAACDKVLSGGFTLLVTLDCGSSDHVRLRRLHGKCDALVIDHHLVPDEPLPAMGFINPHRPECGFPFKWLCSAGLALNVVAGLRANLGSNLNLKQWFDVCAISTIADVAPLIGDNRILVAHGLESIRRKERVGLAALLDKSKIDFKFALTGGDVSWRIAPLMNAPGRLQAPDIIVQLLMIKDAAEAEELATEVARLTQIRRDMTDEIGLAAEAQIQAAGWQQDPALVVGDDSWNHGIVGITAGRLAEKYGRPTVVFGSHGSGSVRGPAGSKLHTMLTECKDFLVKFGGHQAAAGCSIDYTRLSEFREAFCQAALKHPSEPPPEDVNRLLVDSRDSLRDILKDLELLEPCGEGNPRPEFVVEGRVTKAKVVTGNHLSLEVQLPGGQLLKGFKVASGDLAKTLKGQVKLIGDLRPTSFGKAGVEIFIQEIEQ